MTQARGAQDRLVVAARRVVGAVVVAGGLTYWAHDVGMCYLWFTYPLPRTPEGMFEWRYPGYLATVDWVRQRGLASIRSLPYDTDIYVHQRLMEMLYPIRLETTPAAELVAGDLVVMKATENLPQPAKELFAAGMLKVVQVQ